MLNNTDLCGPVTKLNSLTATVRHSINASQPCVSRKQIDVDSMEDLGLVLGGPGTGADASWTGSDPCVGWVGVTCSVAGDVEGVNLTGEGAASFFPPPPPPYLFVCGGVIIIIFAPVFDLRKLS